MAELTYEQRVAIEEAVNRALESDVPADEIKAEVEYAIENYED